MDDVPEIHNSYSAYFNLLYIWDDSDHLCFHQFPDTKRAHNPDPNHQRRDVLERVVF